MVRVVHSYPDWTLRYWSRWFLFLILCALAIGIVALFLPKSGSGPVGEPGADGKAIGNTFITVPYNSSLCEYGGVNITTCYDNDNDGLCNSTVDEILSQQTICGGGSGPKGDPGMDGSPGMDGASFNVTGSQCGSILLWDEVSQQWEPAVVPWVLSFSVTPTTSSYFVSGDYSVVTTGLVATYMPAGPVWWRVSHFFMIVNSLTGSGVVTVTGNRIRSDGVYEIGYVENILVDAGGGQQYQSLTNFAEITQVTIPVGITSINYDIGHTRYWDQGDLPFQLLGIRLEVRGQNQNTDVRFRIRKIQSDSLINPNKFSVVTMEDFAIDSMAGAGTVTDNVRGGAADRSYAIGASLYSTNEPHTTKYLDYATYWGPTSIIRSDREEGLIIDFLDLIQNRELTLFLYYVPISGEC